MNTETVLVYNPEYIKKNSFPASVKIHRTDVTSMYARTFMFLNENVLIDVPDPQVYREVFVWLRDSKGVFHRIGRVEVFVDSDTGKFFFKTQSESLSKQCTQDPSDEKTENPGTTFLL